MSTIMLVKVSDITTETLKLAVTRLISVSWNRRIQIYNIVRGTTILIQFNLSKTVTTTRGALLATSSQLGATIIQTKNVSCMRVRFAEKTPSLTKFHKFFLQNIGICMLKIISDGTKSGTFQECEVNNADFKFSFTTTKFQVFFSVYYFMVLLLLLIVTFMVSLG